jgi:hypothetical protein
VRGARFRGIEFPESIAKIRESIPELAHMSDHAIQALWEGFSQDCFAAGFMIVGEFSITDFVVWLVEKDT